MKTLLLSLLLIGCAGPRRELALAVMPVSHAEVELVKALVEVSAEKEALARSREEADLWRARRDLIREGIRRFHDALTKLVKSL